MPARAARQPKVRPPAPDALDASWRLFLAVLLPDPVKALVGEQIAEFSGEGWPVRWVQPEGAHLTLRFLGETTRERAELVRLAMPAVVAAHEPFDLRTATLGVFPNFRHPRVLWLGLHGPTHRLQALADDVNRAVTELGFPPADDPYHPHITLGRVRNNDGDECPAARPARCRQSALRQPGHWRCPRPRATPGPRPRGRARAQSPRQRRAALRDGGNVFVRGMGEGVANS